MNFKSLRILRMQSGPNCNTWRLEGMAVVLLLVLVTSSVSLQSTSPTSLLSTKESLGGLIHYFVSLTTSVDTSPGPFPKCCPIHQVLDFFTKSCVNDTRETNLDLLPQVEVSVGLPICDNKTLDSFEFGFFKDLLKNLSQNYPTPNFCVDDTSFGGGMFRTVSEMCHELETREKEEKEGEIMTCMLKYKYVDPVVLGISCFSLAVGFTWAVMDSDVRRSLHGRCLLCLLASLFFADTAIIVNRIITVQSSPGPVLCTVIGKPEFAFSWLCDVFCRSVMGFVSRL